MPDPSRQRPKKGARRWRLALSAALAYVMLSALALGLGSGPDAPFSGSAQAADPRVKTFELEVRGGKVLERKNTIRVTEGDTVILRWRLDRAADLHVHGYNHKVAAKAGVPAVVKFKAAIAGRFSISAHWAKGNAARKGHSHHESRLLYLEVYPR